MKIDKIKNYWEYFFQKFETFKGYLNLFLNNNDENLKGFLKWLWELELVVFTKKWELPNTGNYHMQLLKGLIALDTSHKINVTKDNLWHQATMVIT